MNVDDLKELDALMQASKYRAFHLAVFVIAVLVLISTQIVANTAVGLRAIMNIGVWCFGCFVIALFMMFWVRGRVVATIKLKNLIHYDSLEVQDADITPIRGFDVIPLGYEVGVNLISGEHLAFGFWTEQPAQALQELLIKAHRLTLEKKQVPGFEPG